VSGLRSQETKILRLWPDTWNLTYYDFWCEWPALLLLNFTQSPMPRLGYFGALLGLAALLSAPLVAQKDAHSSRVNSPSGARVQHVLVRGSGAAMEVEIQTFGDPVAPDTQAITGPDRIVVDFPGALPAAELRALEVNRGALKRIRTGLFFNNPPITRIVLDLAEPQSYRISTTRNAVVIKLGGRADQGELNLGQTKQDPVNAGKNPVGGARAQAAYVAPAPVARLQNALLPAGTKVAPAQISAAVSHSVLPPANAALPVARATLQPLPAPPAVTVTYADGMLRIRAQKATLAQVLYEVQLKTQAEIAIPAGAEQEEVVADLGPAPARDVLASLLNGSHYNFIFVGNELTLERVILTLRDPNIF
jgi:hypothetical protein